MLFKFIDYMIGVLSPGFFLPGGGSIGIPQITNSLRLRANASAYLSRTPSTTTSRTKWTFSIWLKRGAITGDMRLLEGYSASNSYSSVMFDASNSVLRYITFIAGTPHYNCLSTAVFRDPSAYLHIVVGLDTSLATGTDRVKLWANGVRLTKATDTIGAQNQESYLNLAATAMNIGRHGAGSQYFDGVISRVCFVDGAQLDPSSFAYTDLATGQWVSKSQGECKAVVDSGGANGFMLDFDNGTSLTTLGYDKSSKGNNWTLNNASLTAGVNYDWLTDTPTNNFCNLNPLATSSATGLIPSAGNLLLTNTLTSSASGIRHSIGVSSGKWYWEATRVSWNVYECIGVAPPTVNLSQLQGDGTDCVVLYGTAIRKSGANVQTVAGNANGDVLGVALDLDGLTVTFYKNNVQLGTSVPITAGTYTPVHGVNTGGSAANCTTQYNFGQRPFTYSPPSGFKALCTKNLPAPSIKLPKKHFDAKTYSGVGSGSNTVSGMGLQGDFFWFKSRSNAYAHFITDVVTGFGSSRSSNTTAADSGNVISSATADGFVADWYQIGGGIGGSSASQTFVAWALKAGGAPVANNAGSLASQVSVNPSAGFSIVTYTGAGANATVGHGLGVTPMMVIVKNRTGAARQWCVYHAGIANSQNGGIYLNLANAWNSDATLFNSTAPNSSVFSVGTYLAASTEQLVAYCFAEVPGFSKIGSYTGNGVADGPFVWCGFMPRWILIKRTDTTGNWTVLDTARNPTNVIAAMLNPNLADAEVTGGASINNWDALSNGFKVRGNGALTNASGGNYIFMAFAEAPFNYANAR